MKPYFQPALRPLPLFQPPMAFGDGKQEEQQEEQKDEEQEEQQEEEEQSPEAAAEAKALERQARAQGWRPEAEFKGEGKWVDAATFVDRGNKFKKNLEKKVENLEKAVAAGEETRKQFAQFHKDAMAKKDKELTDAIKAAKLQRSEAIRNGEDDTAVALDDRIDVLKEEQTKLKEAPKEEKKAPAADPDEENPIIQAWVEDGNEWFRDDKRMRAYAMTVGEELRAAGDKSQGADFLNKVRLQMEEDFPAKFKKGNPLRQRAGNVEVGGGGDTSGDIAGRTARDLPKVDRELMEKFVADGLMTKQQFLKDYDWSK